MRTQSGRAQSGSASTSDPSRQYVTLTVAEPSRDPCHLIMVARMEPQKDHVTLLRALAGLPDTGWHVSLVGGGPLEPEVMALTKELGLATKVSSLGTRTDVAELLAYAQVFVLASRWEGLPRSIIEAMRAGMPVVASDVGGVAELITQGDNGFLVSRGDVSGLAGALEALIDDPSLRERMGRRSRERYLAEFTLDRMVEQTERVYEEVLDRARPWVTSAWGLGCWRAWISLLLGRDPLAVPDPAMGTVVD